MSIYVAVGTDRVPLLPFVLLRLLLYKESHYVGKLFTLCRNTATKKGIRNRKQVKEDKLALTLNPHALSTSASVANITLWVISLKKDGQTPQCLIACTM